MQQRTVWHVVGARPNFMKVAPVRAAVAARTNLSQFLVHTGQHADPQMSDVFFRDLELPPPDLFLGVTGGTHASLTGRVMQALEPLLAEHRPDLVLVAGDVNSTLAAALVAAKNDPPIPVAHLEAGLRSFDRTMPEEVNRVVVDRLSDLCLTPSADADDNLRAEGVPPERIVRVGNVMIDSLERALPVSRRITPALLGRLGLEPTRYALATLHRPANVDDPAVLDPLLSLLADLSERLPVVFPVHPRTRVRIDASPVAARASSRLVLCDPLGYFEFQALMAHARLVLTDSGGVQEETTALGVECLTLRDNTERPVTVTEGTNTLVGRDPARIALEVDRVLSGQTKAGRRPALWDGRAAERVADALGAFLQG
jgi:UDP-N-acetylglucosamine 2-epimerase (non-hydrolysing)